MVNSLLASLPRGSALARNLDGSLCRPPVGSLLIRLGRDPGGMYPFLIRRPFLGSQTAAVERGALWEPPSPLTTVQAL